MEASTLHPVYTIFIISAGKKYDVTPAVSTMERIDAEGQIAQRVDLELKNIQVDGIWLSSILKPANRVFVYANDGTKNEEVFRGFLWERLYKSSISDHLLKVTAYDNLIYLQESEDTFYFPAKMSTEQIISQICTTWGIRLEYSYYNITNGKLPVSGKLYDILTTDILDETERHVGYYYTIISDRDTMIVKTAGSNAEMYNFIAGENVISTASGWTMEGVITQIIIVGKAGDDDREPVLLVESRNTDKYGTLQKIHRRDEDTTIEMALGEAQITLSESSKPKWEYEIIAPDIPWIRKGDAVFVSAGDIKDRRLIVSAVRRSFDNKNSKMTLTLVDQNESATWQWLASTTQDSQDRTEDQYHT